MIVYQLACRRGHFFEGWFASSQACDEQAAGGDLRCPTCSSVDIRKLPAAPYVKDSPARLPATAEAQTRARLVAELRRHLLATTDDVGPRFAEVARRIHYQEEAARNIRGKATVEEAAELHEEGVEAYWISPEVIPGGEVH